jgi:hypothetical protein
LKVYYYLATLQPPPLSVRRPFVFAHNFFMPSEATAWINELASLSDNMPGYNAALGMSAFAGMSALNSYRNRAPPLRILPTTKVDYNSARIQALSRAVARYKPAIEETTKATTFNVAAGQVIQNDYVVTDNFAGDADFQSKVLGDKCRLKGITLRYNYPTSGINITRMILYKPKNQGERISNIGYESIIDTSKFQVLADRTFFPSASFQTGPRNNIGVIRVKLNHLLHMNRTSPTSMTVEKGEIVFTALYTSSTGGTVAKQYKLTYQNK